MRFEWDEGKSARNVFRHGLRFETAALVFHDPNALSVKDERYGYIEERWYTLGRVGFQILFVAHTVDEDDYGEEIIRIISARKATPREERLYIDG